MPDTTRQPLRTQEQAHNSLQRMSKQLGSGEALACGNPPTPPEPDLAAKFVYALDAITSQDWQGFAEQCVTTVSNEPAEFGKAILVGIYEFLKSEVEGYVELGSSIIRWTGNTYDCISDVGTGIVDPDLVLQSEVCKPFHGAAQTVMAVRDTIQDLAALGFSGLLELVREMLGMAFELFDDVLAQGLQLLGDLWDEIRNWLQSTAQNVQELGQLVGTLLGSILLEVATAGVGRAIKAAKFVGRLPGASSLGATSLGEATFSMRVTPVENVFNLDALASFGPLSGSSRMRKNLDALGDVIQTVLNKNHRRFSRNMTSTKLKLIQKHVPAENFKRFKRWRREAAKALADEFDDLQGRVKTYRASIAEVQDYNRRVLTFHYAEAVVENDTADYFNLLARRDAIMPDVFESNHIIEERLFHRRSAQWRSEFDRLGWNSPADMQAVLLTASEHTGSARAMLGRYGLSPSEIDAIAPPKSITVTLLDKIKLREDWPGPPGPGMLVIEPNTPFKDVFAKYVEIYSTESPALWNKSLRTQFRQWRDALNLGAIPGL